MGMAGSRRVLLAMVAVATVQQTVSFSTSYSSPILLGGGRNGLALQLSPRSRPARTGAAFPPSLRRATGGCLGIKAVLEPGKDEFDRLVLS
jgi:hypothetical protein